MAHTRPGDEMICGLQAHIYTAAGGGAARIAGVSTNAVSQNGACIRPADVEAAIHPDDPHFPRSALVWSEQPSHGWVMPLTELEDVANVAHAHDIPLHMDGARLFNAAVALGVPARDIARHADTVLFCISKGLAAPVGSVLAGPHRFIVEARRARKVVGGGMRQAGILAAAGLYALDCMIERLADDHRTAQRLAAGLAQIGWVIDRTRVETNMFYASPPSDRDVGDVVSRLCELGIRVGNPYSGRAIRFVTHYGIAEGDVDRALDATARVTRCAG
jgi:threonine aldolase